MIPCAFTYAAPEVLAPYVEQALADSRGWSQAGVAGVRIEWPADLLFRIDRISDGAGATWLPPVIIVNADWRERWYFPDAEAGGERLLQAINHELGHALGLDHSTPALMQATAAWPSAEEIGRVQCRQGGEP